MKHCERCISKEGCKDNNRCYYGDVNENIGAFLRGKSNKDLVDMLIKLSAPEIEDFELCAKISKEIQKRKDAEKILKDLQSK